MTTDPSHCDPLSKRLQEPGPKRLLALDGGGVRGLVSLGFLARIERILRQRYGKPTLVLNDYFDLVGGTSTGSIIAALLALGFAVKEIRRLYLTLAEEAFHPRKSWLGPVSRLIGPRYDEARFEGLLKTHFGSRTLDSADLQVGLMITVKRADTGSVWPLVNIPGHRFYEMNRKMALWEIIRCSTAAPHYFKPRAVDDVGGGEQGVFVDGGLSMHSNPALQLLMAANLKGFGLRWPLGEENLLLCSVGTGVFTFNSSIAALKSYSTLHWLGLLINQLIKDSSELNQIILQWMSRSPTAKYIDRQIERLTQDSLGVAPFLWYLRYDVELEAAALEELGIQLSRNEIEAIKRGSKTENISSLDAIGTLAAQKHVTENHFPRSFDRPPSYESLFSG